MADAIDRLASGILRDAATTVDKMKPLVVAARCTAEEALSRVSTMFRSMADNIEKKAD